MQTNRIKSFFFTMASALFFSSVPARAEVWRIDPQHSVANFKIKHLAIANVSGSVTGIEGVIKEQAAPGKIEEISATLAVATLTTSNEKRDAHLKSPDFFDLAHFPTIVFHANNIVGEAADGELTIHGVTKKVRLAGLNLSPAITDGEKRLRRAFSATAVINRKDFGLTWNKTLDGGGILIGDEVKIDVELELQKESPRVAKK